MTFFVEWMQRWKARNAYAVVGYRFGDAPTSAEMAQAGRAALVDGCMHPLTADQIQALSELIEECGEVIHAAAKVLQGGYAARSRRGKGMSRRILLERELGHLSAALAVLYDAGDVRLRKVRVWEQRQRSGVQSAPAAAAPTSEQESVAGQ